MRKSPPGAPVSMSAPQHIPFADRAGFAAAVLRVLRPAHRSIAIVDRDLQGWPFETLEGDAVLRAALRRGARLRLLVAQPAWLESNGTRFMRARRDFAEWIECRTYPATLRIEESALVVDGRHLARRPNQENSNGSCVLDAPSAAGPVCERFDAAWDESVPCLQATTLGL